MRYRHRNYKLSPAALGVSIGLITSLAGSETWTEPFDAGGGLFCGEAAAYSDPSTLSRRCLDVFRDDHGSGSYQVLGGELHVTFGPCPHRGRSLYVWPRGVFAGDIEVVVVARLPTVGKLLVFAHGDNRSGGYRGLLYPDGQLELTRLDYRGESTVLAAAYMPEMAMLAGMASVHLRLRTIGNDVALATWTAGSNSSDLQEDSIRVTDAVFRSGNVGAGVKEPGYGEVAVFDTLRITHGSTSGGSPSFLRGDANADGAVGIADAAGILGWLVGGDPHIRCLAAADADADGGVDISDAISLLDYLFMGGEALRAPFPRCGPATGTKLECHETPCE